MWDTELKLIVKGVSLQLTQRNYLFRDFYDKYVEKEYLFQISYIFFPKNTIR